MNVARSNNRWEGFKVPRPSYLARLPKALHAKVASAVEIETHRPNFLSAFIHTN